MRTLPYSLTYVCKWCGDTVASYPNVGSHEPATFTVCDKRRCRDAAATEYRAIHFGIVPTTVPR